MSFKVGDRVEVIRPAEGADNPEAFERRSQGEWPEVGA